MRITWDWINSELINLNEKQCWALLEKEKKAKDRPAVKMRIYGRASRLRAERERKELGIH